MFLFSCLGNVGLKYKNNVHNLGFIFADLLQSRFNFSWSNGFHSNYGQFIFDGKKILIQKPLTFMNKSGDALLAAKSFYKIDNDKIFVVHDDIDLADGKIRIKFSGGNGGHNGLRSIDSLIGRDYWRIRVGAGRPENKEDVAKFVLGDVSKESMARILRKYEIILDNLDLLLCCGDNSNTIGILTEKIQTTN